MIKPNSGKVIMCGKPCGFHAVPKKMIGAHDGPATFCKLVVRARAPVAESFASLVCGFPFSGKSDSRSASRAGEGAEVNESQDISPSD